MYSLNLFSLTFVYSIDRSLNVNFIAAGWRQLFEPEMGLSEGLASADSP